MSTRSCLEIYQARKMSAFPDSVAPNVNGHQSVHISALPPEVLTHIFAQLDVRSKGRAARVCTTWRDVAYQKTIWTGVEADINLSTPCPHLFASLSRRGIRRVKLLDLSIRVRDLATNIRDLHSLDFSETTYYVTNVTLYSAFASKLPHLQELNLTLCMLITDSSMSVVVGNCPNLVTLNLTKCRKLTSRSLLNVARHLSKLRRLGLRGCVGMSPAGLKHVVGQRVGLANGNLGLEMLDLCDCDWMTDKAVRHLSGLRWLTTLDMSGCTKLTDSVFAHLSKLDRLTTLTLRDGEMDFRARKVALLANPNVRLISLDLSNCCSLDDDALFHFARMTHLRRLNLSQCVSLTDDGLGHLADAVSALDSLSLCGNACITNSGLDRLAELFHLRELDLSHCSRITSMGLFYLAEGAQSLTGLNIHGCTAVGSRALKHIARGLTELRCLTMNEGHLDGDGLVMAARRLAKLESVTVDSRSVMGDIVKLRVG